MRLTNARRTKAEDTTDDDVPSTSGRQFIDASASDSSQSHNLKVVRVQILFLQDHVYHKSSFILVYFLKLSRIDVFMNKIFAAFWSIPATSLWTGIWLGKWKVTNIWSKDSRNSYITVWNSQKFCCSVEILSSFYLYVDLHTDLFVLFPTLLGGLSGLKISVKVLSLSFQAGLVGKQLLYWCYMVDELLFANGFHAFMPLFATLKLYVVNTNLSLYLSLPIYIYIYKFSRAIFWYNLLIQ